MHRPVTERTSPAAVTAATAAPPASPEISPAKETARREQQMRPRIRYLGFRTTSLGREYTLSASAASVEGEARVFVMTIPHQAFAARQARFQDAPDVCCAKLTRLLAAEGDEPAPAERMVFTAEELLEYQDAHAPAPSGRKRGEPRR